MTSSYGGFPVLLPPCRGRWGDFDLDRTSADVAVHAAAGVYSSLVLRLRRVSMPELGTPVVMSSVLHLKSKSSLLGTFGAAAAPRCPFEVDGSGCVSKVGRFIWDLY